ncbi:MAG: bifunctional enoyl-CoA hydratase/phosphate acetyltransferase [bacterium]|jgi:phosphate butyryltransferase
MLRAFDDVLARVQARTTPKRVGVVAAIDANSIEAVLKAKEEKIVEPVLIGDRKKIVAIFDELNVAEDFEIVDVPDIREAAVKAVEMVHSKEIDFLMKGKIETADLLKAVVDKEKGIRTGRLMTHVVFDEVPTYHKLFITTDGGMVMYPDVEQKKQIIENAVEVMHMLGYAQPKVACLAAIERVNPKMTETVDADMLKQMNQEGKITGCIVEGPISFDLAFSREVAVLKGYDSPVAGDADIFLVPNITAGNILGKTLVTAAGGKMAGFIYGAQVPIILTSRASSAEEKYLSLAMASLIEME